MKKVGILFFCLMAAGCMGKSDVVECKIDGKKAVFTLKSGMIDEYKLGSDKKTNREIAEINGEFFTSSKDNEDARSYLRNYVESIGGTCD